MKILVSLNGSKNDGDKYNALYAALLDFLPDEDRKNLKTNKIVAHIEYGSSGI